VGGGGGGGARRGVRFIGHFFHFQTSAFASGCMKGVVAIESVVLSSFHSV
jgi:hypothetical protein